jgi:hypothetical protein
VNANLTFRKCWQNKEVAGITTFVNASNRLIVVHLGGSGGFVEGCELVYKASKATGDYHGQTHSDNFEKWMNEKVIPNLATLSSSWIMRPTTENRLIILRPSHLQRKTCWNICEGTECHVKRVWGNSHCSR